MRIFIAADWKHRREAHTAMVALANWGHEVTCDWTAETAKTPDALARIADRDVHGVVRADGLIALMSRSGGYRGVWFEIGLALALGKPVVVIGKHRHDCIYGHHAAVLAAPALAAAVAILQAELSAADQMLPLLWKRLWRSGKHGG
jgi:nucleoside 2-deoxyribosyltransferase